MRLSRIESSVHFPTSIFSRFETTPHTARPKNTHQVHGDPSVRGLGLDWVDFYLAVPPSAWFSLGSWEVGRTGCVVGQDGGTPQIEVNRTQSATRSTSLYTARTHIRKPRKYVIPYHNGARAHYADNHLVLWSHPSVVDPV